MFEIVPYKQEHLIALLSDPMNERLKPFFLTGVKMAARLEGSNAVTIIHEGRVIACGGITEIWMGRGHIWSMFSERSKECFVGTFRAIKRWLAEQIAKNYQRIEMSVPCEFANGKRRAELLGFSLECAVAKKYLPDGEDCAVYSMVRG